MPANEVVLLAMWLFLEASFSHTTATGLSGLVDNAISHDPVTRFLSQQDFTSKELGKVIKKTVREGNIIRVRSISY
jgi:multisubunit Na+/H+ antiporter MnhE subunit